MHNWAVDNINYVELLPPLQTEVTTRLVDVLEDEVDEKYYLSEEKTKKLTLDNDLGGELNMYDFNERDKVHSVNKVSHTLNTMQGGDRQPKVVVIGNTSNTGHRSHDVHDTDGISPTIAARDYKGAKQIAEVQQTGNTTDAVIPVLTPDRLNKRQNGRRFKEDGEPMFTLTSQDRHGIAVREATKKGYTIAEQGDSVNYTYPTSKTRRGRVGKQVAQTLQAGEVNQGVVIDDTQGYDGVRYYKGIAPTLRSSRSGLKTVVAPKEESGEVNQGVVMENKGIRFTEDGFHTHRNDKKKSSIQGTHVTYKKGKTHALTSNHVPMTLQAGGVNQDVVIGVGHHPFSKKREFNGYGLICPTLIATDYKAPKTVLTNNLRIRKLTPLECWRLQGFTDEQFYKAQSEGVSNSQLYKQSGNAITISVADAIIKKITEG
ncbi:MAG: DNA cytosine methyltransferase [Staphylococcus equorum]|nr:DNA cytosine methyltransferase [Staphylococcus equorum]